MVHELPIRLGVSRNSRMLQDRLPTTLTPAHLTPLSQAGFRRRTLPQDILDKLECSAEVIVGSARVGRLQEDTQHAQTARGDRTCRCVVRSRLGRVEVPSRYSGGVELVEEGVGETAADVCVFLGTGAEGCERQ